MAIEKLTSFDSEIVIRGFNLEVQLVTARQILSAERAE